MIKRVILAACIFSSAITVNSHLVSAEKESSRTVSTEVGKDHEVNKRHSDSGEIATDKLPQIKPEKTGANTKDKALSKSGGSAV